MTAERNLGSPNSSSNYPAYEAASLSGIARWKIQELLYLRGIFFTLFTMITQKSSLELFSRAFDIKEGFVHFVHTDHTKILL